MLLTVKNFESKDTPALAKFLLGKVLVRRVDGEIIKARIVEVEAYDGFFDKASHAHRGKTERNEVMFGEGFVWYVYLVYGMHNMLNLVTGPKDYPAAILIRGIEIDGERVEGPGKLTKLLNITRDLNGLAVYEGSGLWLEYDGFEVGEILETPRVGIDYAKEWKDKPYRFVLR